MYVYMYILHTLISIQLQEYMPLKILSLLTFFLLYCAQHQVTVMNGAQ